MPFSELTLQMLGSKRESDMAFQGRNEQTLPSPE